MNANREHLVPYVSENAARINYLTNFSGPQGKAQFWFGVVDYDQVQTEKQLDYTQGPLAPFIETNYSAFQCPDFGLAQMQLVKYGQPPLDTVTTPTYLSRTSGVEWLPPTYAATPTKKPLSWKLNAIKTTNQTVVFADSAQVRR